MRFLEDPPRFVFFTGKGGVGKTSVACATAVHLAGHAKQVLLVSTDPASNVGQVLGLRIGNTITAVEQVPGLAALEINPGQAAAAYRERILAPVRGLLPAKELAAITEQLSGSCTTEIASFNEFTALLADEHLTAGYDHVVFDTAPTGHTLRLLQLPASWTDFLAEGKGDASCLGPLSGLDRQKAMYARAVDVLKDPAQTRMVLVSRPQASALAEMERTSGELGQLGITGQYAVINAVLPPASGEDDLSRAVRAREARALAAMPPTIAGLPRDLLPLRAMNVIGVEALRSLFHPEETVAEAAEAAVPTLPDVADSSLAGLVDGILQADHGLVMCMGKGGVGKTTIAAAIAVALAHAGREVHLTTTDPAAHLTETLNGIVPGLKVSRIDPAAAVQAYRDHVMATKGKGLDDAGRAGLAEDLQSPCTEEIAVFQQFSRVLTESRRRFVVVDTAPTGHTLLLLDATGSYHRDVARHMGDSKTFTTPLMRLQDPVQTKVTLVTLAETTPVLEAQELQEDLERAGIHPWAWVINNSISAARPEARFLQLRAASETGQIDRVRALADRVAIVPLRATEPTGEVELAALSGLVRQPP